MNDTNNSDKPSAKFNGHENWSLWRVLRILLFPLLIMVNPKLYFKDVQDLPDIDANPNWEKENPRE